jgi:hypothetical protein
LSEQKAIRPVAALALFGLLLAICAGAGPANAAEEASAKFLLAPAAPVPRGGLYVANDDLQFMLDTSDGQARLRFPGSDEVFYLSSEPAPLGGRVLRYDTGEVALQVAGWGGVTLYTEGTRSGIPAERQDEATGFDAAILAGSDVRPFAAKLTGELFWRDGLAVGFTADWDLLARAPDARALAGDAMRNAAYALKQVAKGDRHAAITAGLHVVELIRADKPGVELRKGVLTVAYAPDSGPSARPSSYAIARALEGGF